MLALLIFSLFATPSQAADAVLTKAQFLDGMKIGLPDSFCADKTYFRKCFSGTKEDCAKETAKAEAACADKLQAEIPAELKQPADGQKFGEKLGSCAGAQYEQDLAKTKVKNADCEDASKWK